MAALNALPAASTTVTAVVLRGGAPAIPSCGRLGKARSPITARSSPRCSSVSSVAGSSPVDAGSP